MALYADLEPVIKQLTSVCLTDDVMGMGKQMGINYALEILGKAPLVEAEPVVHAHWVDRPDGAYRICTNCNCGVPTMPQPPAWFRCPVCGAHMDEKRLVPMYLGNCEETDCEHWRWCGDSYHDRNTECYCLLNGKSVYRHEAEEKMILCPLGKMMEDEEEE